MWFKKELQKLNCTDIGLIKLASFIFALWLIALLPGFANWVQSTSHWWFLVISIVAAARPFHKFYLKK